MESQKIKKYIKDLANYLADNDYTLRPLPKIILNRTPQDELLGKTGYYDPDKKEITVFIGNRLLKDYLRSIAHELIHHKQNLDGRLGNGAYSGDRISEDKKLLKLEIEAYQQGNISFRNFTEELQKKMQSKQ